MEAVKLVPEKIRIEKLLLDPNNFRLFGETRRERVPEDRIADENVQQSVLEEMKKIGDLLPLRNSILEVGFQPIDRIVVRLFTKGKYVVVEGNRRIAAIKWILEDYKRGEIEIPDEKLKTLKKIDAIVVIGARKEDILTYQHLIQGVRHIQGIKSWGPYQKALMVTELHEKMKMGPREIANALGGGVSTRSVINMFRAFKALKQMEDDEEFGEYVEPELYSYFEEVMKKPFLREWLGWNDDKGEFLNQDNIKLFYSWITPSEDLSGRKKIPMAIKVRELPSILQNEELYTFFLQPNVDIDEAITEGKIRKKRIGIAWREKLKEMESIIKEGIPLGATLTDEDINLLENLKILIEEILKRIKKLKES